VTAVSPAETLPRFQNWSVTFKRRLTENIMLDLSYIGTRGSRLVHSAQRFGLDFNMNDPSVLALGANVLNAPIGSDIANNAGITSPYPGFSGNVAQALRKYPQYQNIDWRGTPLGRSQYHALELVLEQRLARGLQYRVGYTYSNLKNNGAESAQANGFNNGGVQDPVNWDQADYGLSQDDTPHVLLVGFTWDIAQGSSQNWSGAKKAFLGGWNLSGILRYESGRPLRITMANDMGGLLFNTQKRPNRTGSGRGPPALQPDTDNYQPTAGRPRSAHFRRRAEADGSVRGFRCSTKTHRLRPGLKAT
jgi:hypothetical protein